MALSVGRSPLLQCVISSGLTLHRLTHMHSCKVLEAYPCLCAAGFASPAPPVTAATAHDTHLEAGVPEKGRLFCERVPFPEANLFLDPERVAYRELSLYEGFGRTFFSRATPKACPSFYLCIMRTHGNVQPG